VKTTVFNYDALKNGGQRLLIVEGPFDAIKIDNHNFNISMDTAVEFRATCTFGTSPTISQIAILRALVKRFDEAWVLFDAGADQQGNELAEWVGAKQAYLPVGFEDPGELKARQLNNFGKLKFNGTFFWYAN
jgi:L-alanine-DL-glutamate epimerase-like enolase superfamily enzyme